MYKKLRVHGRLINWFLGAVYDFSRFFLYGGWRCDLSDQQERNYYASKVYHSLEKSMSYTDHSPSSGWANAAIVIEILEAAVKYKNAGFHDKIAALVLGSFIEKNNGETTTVIANQVRTKFDHLKSQIDTNVEDDFGVFNSSKNDLHKGMLSSPEDFFFTRHSIREFGNVDSSVDKSTLEKAVRLSLKTPSACNRQAWHVYHISDQKKIKKALSHQKGNRGFGHKVNDLLVICSDIKAFNPGSERYQHWIDGGMYSMSLVYALHSVGIASCCLNWSQQGKDDKGFRKDFPEISNSHSVIIMLAIGEPKENNQICVSPRRPMSEIFTEL
ncbi:nitroreductase family protein [Vibrio breoganii]